MSSFNVRNETPIGSGRVEDLKKRLALARSRIPQFTPAQIQEQVVAGHRRFNPIASNIGRMNLEELFKLRDVSKRIGSYNPAATKIQALIRGENARAKITRGGRWSMSDLLDTGETSPAWIEEDWEDELEPYELEPYEADPEGWEFRKRLVEDELEGVGWGQQRGRGKIWMMEGAVSNFHPDNPRAWAERYDPRNIDDAIFHPKLPVHKRTLRKMLEETRRRVGAPK